MSTGNFKGKQLSSLFLTLCCLAFCLSACIRGKITADGCTGTISIQVRIEGVEETFITTIDASQPNYTIQVPIEHVGKNATAFASCQNDPSSKPAGCWLAIGDYWGWYGGGFGETFEIEYDNPNIDITLNNKITHQVSGEITCDEHDGTGCLGVTVWNKNPFTGASTENLIGVLGCYPITEPGPYTKLISNSVDGDNVFAIGSWDVDCSTGAPNSGDYYGAYPGTSFPLEPGETPGIDFDACQLRQE